MPKMDYSKIAKRWELGPQTPV